MTVDALDLLAAIRRSGGDVRLAGCNRLKLIAPTALLPELVDRVRAAKPALLAALANNRQVAGPDQGGWGGVLNPSRNAATAQHPRADPSADRVTPMPAGDWRAHHREALAYWSALRSADEAAGLAWGEMENRWHRLHGERVPKWQCAGCGELIGGRLAFDLADGNRVHFDALDCLLSFGERWRSGAAAGLRAMGLDPAPGFEPL